MTLSPAEIDRWSADAIGTVAQIVATRADGTRAVSAAIRRAVEFLDWTGDTGEAASAAISRTIRDLDSHADACDAVARAVDKAVQEVAAVKLRLRQICNTAHDYHLSIDDETAAVHMPTDLSTFSAADQREITDARLRVAAAIKTLLADADTIDADLNAAIRDADSTLSPGRVDAEIPCGPTMIALPPAADTSPAEVNKWWRSLTPPQRERITAWSSDSIRNLDGIPIEIRDELNRAALPREITRLQNGWLDRDGRLHIDHDKLADLTALQDTLCSHPDLGLLLLDAVSNPRNMLAAVAKGDVDNAERVGVTVGGMGTNVRDSIAGMADQAIAQFDTATDIRSCAGLPNPKAVASIAWLGYDTPGLDLSVTGDAMAHAGAKQLNRFYHALATTTKVANQQITAFGHSYGSLTTSLALQQGAPVDDVVFYGSPGAEISNAAQLGIAPGHAYFEVGVNDPVATMIAQAHRFGAPIQEVPGFQQLSTYAGMDPYGTYHDWSYGHSEYARNGNRDALTMGGYNLSAVLSGVPGATVAAPGPWPPGLILGPDGRPPPGSAYPP